MKLRNQNGFGIAETAIVVLLVAVLAGGSYFLWHRSHGDTAVSKNHQSSTNNSDVAANFNECLELGGTQPPESTTTTKDSCSLHGKTFNVTSANLPEAWSQVKTATVHLKKWNVTLTVPQSLVGNVYYQVDPSENIYDFTTTNMFAPSCIAYFGQHGQEASVEADQYPPTKPAKDIVANAGSMTLDSYYNAHKVANGNYFLVASTNKKVWKIGNHFYQLLTDSSAYHGAAFTAACPGVSSQYQTELANMIPTIKEN
jgi:hypothetical protein